MEANGSNNLADVWISLWQTNRESDTPIIVRLLDYSASEIRFAHCNAMQANDHVALKDSIKTGPPHNALYRVRHCQSVPGFFVISAEFVCLMSNEQEMGHGDRAAAQQIGRLIIA